jgi:hypothetical protein
VGEVAVVEILVAVAVIAAAHEVVKVAALKRVGRDLIKLCVHIQLTIKIQRVQIPPRIKNQDDEFFII